MNLKVLLAIFQLHASNMQVIHWHAKGKRFDKIHSITNDYYEKISEDVDEIAEFALRLGIRANSYTDVMSELRVYQGREFKVLDSTKDYEYDEAVSTIDYILGDILYGIEQELASEEMKCPCNVGIKSALESIHNEYDLQKRFINARRFDD